jgi:MtrB/PioB family decaheme-associated outer membrane protein
MSWHDFMTCGGSLQGRTSRLLTSLLLLPLPAFGAEVDTSAWECNFCPFEDGQATGEVQAGSLYVDGAAAKFGEFDGISEDGGYLAIDGSSGQREASGTFWRVSANDLGLDNGSFAAAAGKEGSWKVGLGYTASPHDVYDTTVTPFSASESTLVLPAGWVRAGNTGFMTALDSSLRPYDVETNRELWSLGGNFQGASGWDTELLFTHETRDGRRLMGSNFVTTASQLPGPVDFVTDQVDWTARYETGRAAVALSFFGSYFSNRRHALAWENPFTAIAPGADLGRSALAPDNNYNNLDGALGRAQQDDDFLPYTSNPLIATTALPRESLGGEVDVRNVNLQLFGGLGTMIAWLEGLQARLSYRYYERDNATRQSDYNYVESDSFPAGTETNIPYGYRRQKLSLTGDYDLGRVLLPGSGHLLRLSGGWDREEWDRKFQEADNSTEDRGWARLRFNPLQWLSFDARAGAANRDTDPYVANPPGSAPQNPLMRKFNLADRERDFWDLSAHLALPGDLALSLAGFHRQDDYVNSELGLARSRDSGGTADLSWAISEKISAFAFHGRQEISSVQRGSQSFSSPDWQAETVDRFDTSSIGLRMDGLRDRWNVQFDYFLVDGRGEIEMRSGLTTKFPPLRTRSHGPTIEVEYRATPALDIIGLFRYEHFDSDDWALDGVAPDTLPSILASGADAYDYDASLIGLSFRYRLGGGAGDSEADEPE